MNGSETELMEQLQSFWAAYSVVIIVAAVISIIATWKIFTKAGKPGWASIIPFYSQYLLFEMVGMKGWYIFLIFIPIVGAFIVYVLSLVAHFRLAKCFGKSTGFGIGMIFLSFIFTLILGFDSSTYTKPATAK